VEDTQWQKDVAGRDPGRRAKLRLGIGTSQALWVIGITASLTALLIYSFRVRWPALVDVMIGAVWALAVGGFVIVPIIGRFLADALSQFGKAKPLPAPPGRQKEPDEWEERRHIRPEPSDIGLHLPPTTSQRLRDGGQRARGYDWGGFISEVAARLAQALGEGFTAEGDGSSLVIRKGDQVRHINLGSILQPPPLDVAERAMRACLKMMDEAQMFAMRVKHEPWPVRSLADETGPSNLARPRVRMDDEQISMSWADSHGTVIRLGPVPLFENRSEPAAGDQSIW
jgi:hypothetical protein